MYTQLIGKKVMIVLMLLSAVVCLGIGMAFGESGNELFEETAIPADAKITVQKDKSTIVRTRYVKVNFDLLLDRETDKTDAQEDRGVIVLNLFDDVSFTAVKDRTEKRSEKNYTWFGTLERVPYGHVVLTVEDGDMAGNISFPGGFYQIRPIGSGYHAIYEMDQSAFPEEAPPVEVPPDSSDSSSAETSADDGSIIDMLVVYTPAAASHSANISAEIQLAIDETNQAYINSGMYHRVRLAGKSQVTYTESGFLCNHTPSDLTRLRGTSDGYMDNVHSLRNTYRADQVTLIVDTGDACGCAYMMSSVSSGFESSAFSVVRRDCATGYYSFGHELGHNMGARHDCYVDSTLGAPYNYNHGYVYVPDRWRTIMAYNNECAATYPYTYCTRIQYFSNPSVSYSGHPTGTTGAGCTANVRSTFANTDYTVSNFRAGQCTKYGHVSRVSVYPGSSSSYIYVTPYGTTGYYTQFATSDSKLLKAAIKACPSKARVYIRGNQSCFDATSDYGGGANYLAISP